MKFIVETGIYTTPLAFDKLPQTYANRMNSPNNQLKMRIPLIQSNNDAGKTSKNTA